MPKKKQRTTDGIVKLYARLKRRPKFTIQKLDKETVLIEGSAKALEFLGNFILAHSRADADDCYRQMWPKGGGGVWFTRDSTLGIYLHRIPCKGEWPIAKKRRKLK